MSNRTVTELAKMEERIHVLVPDAETQKCFLFQTTEEGFTFSDGASPMARPCDDIMAVHKDKTISFVGYAGYVAFNSNAAMMGDEKYLRVDFKKYIDGDEEFIIKRDGPVPENLYFI